MDVKTPTRRWEPRTDGPGADLMYGTRVVASYWRGVHNSVWVAVGANGYIGPDTARMYWTEEEARHDIESVFGKAQEGG